MLNRIYIVVGIFAILVLAGAFVVPRFIQWGDYRDRMEALATDVLGADVTIRGDISFSLLPTPHLAFSDVVVGDAESPAATVASVDADFALIDFLRDRYTVTALTLNRPVIDLVLDENGLFSSAISVETHSGVALDQARIANGSVRLTDLRADERFALDRIDGDLRLASFSGPFQFQGSADYGDTRYALRFNSGSLDANGAAKVSSFIQPADGSRSITAEGMLTAGIAPRFEGTLVYRQKPPASDAAEDIRGDMVLESSLSISTDRVVMSSYTLNPDESRTGMRLTGAASIQLGARRAFDAVVSGGVFSLPPRAATETPAELPYELVRLLFELPAPPVTDLPGKVGIDLAEVGLRGFSLRELRLDATTDGQSWTIQQAVARLPGDSQLRLSGTLSNDGGTPGFVGEMALETQRLDALATLWRRSGEDNPLFNMPGGIKAKVLLAGEALGLSNGTLTLDGMAQGFDLRIGFGSEKRLDTTLRLAEIDAAHSQALLALLPDISADKSFAASFPNGSFALTAQSLDVTGIAAKNLVAEGQWSPDALRFSRLATTDWGGIGLDGGLRLSGSLLAPRVTGSGKLSVASADGAGLEAFYELAGVPFGWQQALARAWPGEAQLILSDDETGPGQVLTAAGTLGPAKLDLRAEMAEGLSHLADGNLRLIGSLEAADADAAAAQFGLGDVPLFDGTAPMIGSVFFEGSGTRGFDGRAALSQGEQSIGYFGHVDVAGSGQLSGDGTLDVQIDHADGLAALAGATGTGLPGLKASGALRFDGLKTLALDNIAGASGDAAIGGALAMQQVGQLPSFSGALTLDAVDAVGLAAALFGNEALIGTGDGFWPEGPLATSPAPRPSRGEIAVTTSAVTANGAPLLGETGFTFSWAQDSIGIERLKGKIGDGTLELSLVQCCAGPLTDRTITGRLSLSGAALDALLPPAMTAGLDGTLEGGLQFEATGASLADAASRMTGEGNFSIAELVATGLSPGVYPAVAGIGDVLNTDADALETLLSLALTGGDFTADLAQGAFTIAGGTARLANLIVDGDGARLGGSLNLALPTLGLDGSFALTPRNFTDTSGLVEPDTARVLMRIAGTVLAPEVSVDLGELVAAIQVRANEIELDRLEVLQQQDAERQRAAAEERNRLVEEQRRQAAEEAAQRAAAEEAQRLEQERLLQQQQQTTPAPAPTNPAPLNLDFNPAANQPAGTSVNQPGGNLTVNRPAGSVNQPIQLIPN